MHQVGVQNITAVVSVTSQNRLFKFNKVTAPNGVPILSFGQISY